MLYLCGVNFNVTTMRIKEVIQEKGLTINKVAELMGVNRVSLSTAINGNPTLETLEKIARALKVEVWELFTPSTSTGNFMALVKDGGNYYHASSLAELKDIVNEIEAKP